MNLGLVDYSNKDCPEGYKCSKCGRTHSRLWRQYNTFADCIKLLCSKCAPENQGITGIFNKDGRFFKDGSLQPSYSIELLVPAIPTEDGRTYWGAFGIPQEGFNWWIKLEL